MEIKSEVHLLESLRRYVTLSPEEEAIILSKIRHRTYLKNQYIVQQGDVCRKVVFILSGCAKTFFMDEEGTQHITMFSVEHWWCSDVGSFINQTPADYNIQCLERTKLIEFTHETLEELFVLIPKLERFFKQVLAKAFAVSQKRIISTFSKSALERYQAFKKTYTQIEQRVPQYMIASYLGITKEFLSKIKSQIHEIETNKIRLMN